MALRQSYDKNGFFIHDSPLLSAELIERAAQGIGAVRDCVYDTGEAPAGRLWNPGDDLRSLCKIEQPQLANHALREAVASPSLGQIAGAISGAATVQVWWVQLLYKPGAASAAGSGAPTKVGWHQDRSYWQDWGEESELFTAWLALSDVNNDAGPMVFVPGSHRWGLLEGGDFFAQDQQELRASIAIPDGESWREVPDVLPCGGASFHHPLLFHGSHQNVSDKPRLSLAIHLRTEKSAVRAGSSFTRFLDRPEICPVIFQR